MGAMFVGQQFLQNVLGYSTLEAGAAILPAAVFMVLVAPRSAKLVEARGARFTLLSGYVFCLLGFLTMLLLWKDGISYWKVGLGYALIGIGVGFAGTPASHSLTGSVPVKRAGMASGTADLQRDLGGAIMQSILGALLTAGYAAAARGRDRRLGQADHRQRPEPADEVLRRRRGRRGAVPAVREPDHGRGEDLVPARRPVGLHRRDRRDPARRGARLLPLPEEGGRGAVARAVPRRGRHNGLSNRPPEPPAADDSITLGIGVAAAPTRALPHARCRPSTDSCRRRPRPGPRRRRLRLRVPAPPTKCRSRRSSLVS